MKNGVNGSGKESEWDFWYPPEFSRFGEPLALQMRDFLFGDRSASYGMGDSPEQWAKSGAVLTMQRKPITYSALAAGATGTESINIGGGKNALVFSRMATVRLDAVAQATLPNSLADYVTVKIEREDNTIEVNTVPISHHFGMVSGWPVTPATPEFWLGNLKKTVTVVNNWSATLSVVVSWEIMVLNTGR